MQNKRRIRAWALQCCAFGAAALLVFLGLGHLFYTRYGDPFLHEAFLHHLGRHDPRHNFSPHFYFTYLYYFNPAAAQTLASISASPVHDGALLTPAAASDVYASDFDASNQSELLAPSMPAWQNPAACAMPISAVVICCLALCLSRHLDLCWLLTTLAFVAFNKVSTAQYFVWYFGLLPLVWPNMRWDRWRVLAGAGAFWLLTQVNWLLWAYLLEFQVCACCSLVSMHRLTVAGVMAASVLL